MGPPVVPGTANRLFANAIATALRTEPVTFELERFPDGELRPVVDHVRGDDVYVVQPTGPAVSNHLMELFLLLDACRRGGAERITAVLPYFGYARQDRRGRVGEAVGARVVADALVGSGAQRLVVVDLHSTALEAMCGIPVETLTAVPVLAGLLAPSVAEGAVVVAPDLGAVKLAEHYASLLHRPVAVVCKTRVTGATVRAEEVAGDVAGQSAVIVNDMISTGATIEAAAGLSLDSGARPTSWSLRPMACWWEGPPTDSGGCRCGACSPPTASAGIRHRCPCFKVESIAALLADAISRLHHSQQLGDLLVRT
jgi:ribose-phosphate pyrophosphokinase